MTKHFKRVDPSVNNKIQKIGYPFFSYQKLFVCISRSACHAMAFMVNVAKWDNFPHCIC